MASVAGEISISPLFTSKRAMTDEQSEISTN